MGGKGGWSTRKRPAEERFFEKVNAMGCCWEWDGAVKTHGYGNFCPHRSRTMQAHRWAWEYLIGPIPEGMVLDHLCRNKRCVNPEHLEIVTPAENQRRAARRGSFCRRGHLFDAANTYIDARGGRICRTCVRQNRAKRPIAVQQLNAYRTHAGLPTGEDRRTHCGKGHEFTLENTYHSPRGLRLCRSCQSERSRKARAALAEAPAVAVAA